MIITQMIIPISKARPERKITAFKGVTVHNTGNGGKGANALSHAKYLLNNTHKEKSWHYCVDETNITQSIPENEVAWHAGDGEKGKGNNATIAIEICMNSDGDILKATDNAVALTADILKRHGIDKADGFVFQHNHWSGKDCPQMIRKGIPYDWNTFISNVNALLQGDELLKAKQTIKDKVGLSDETIKYMENYKFGKDLLIKISKALK